MYHEDFYYASDADWDRAEAYELGAQNPDQAWIITDRDAVHANPFYKGPPVPHPEEPCAEELAYMAAEQAKADISRQDDLEAGGPKFEKTYSSYQAEFSTLQDYYHIPF